MGVLMAGKRKLGSWLKALEEYVEDTEAPRQFWFWSGLVTLGSVIQRKLYLPYGFERVYPNLYVLLIADPAARKGAPVKLCEQFVKKLQIATSRDSCSKREFTKRLAGVVDTQKYFDSESNAWRGQSALTICSKELGSFLAVDPKGMIDVLTDLFDCHDVWDYGTSGQGEDVLYNVCINFFAATTPVWFSENLPKESSGTGFTSRIIMISDNEVYKRVPRPTYTANQERLRLLMEHDLELISRLQGAFLWEPAAIEAFDKWYMGIDRINSACHDPRVKPFIGRLHIHILKVAMLLKISESDELILDEISIRRAIILIEQILERLPEAFGGYGPSRTSIQVHQVRLQIKLLKQVAFGELLASNLRLTNRTELREIVDTLVAAGDVGQKYDMKGKETLVWKGDKS
jgi:hypothetical protein